MSLALHQLGQMRRLDLLALAFEEIGPGCGDTLPLRLGGASRDFLLDVLTRPGGVRAIASQPQAGCPLGLDAGSGR